MRNLFAGRSKPHIEHVERLKGWARMAWSVPEDATVMVTELECREPDCPPIETVVAVLQAGHPTKQYTIHKTICEVLEADLSMTHHDTDRLHHREDLHEDDRARRTDTKGRPAGPAQDLPEDHSAARAWLKEAHS